MVTIPLPKHAFDSLLGLLDTVEAKYGFDMQKICAPNYNKFVLWQRAFPGGSVNDRMAAIKFVVFCCLVDKILDSPRFTEAEKEAVCRKVDVRHLTAEVPYQSESFPEIDALLNDIRIHLIAPEWRDSACLPMLLKKMDRAFTSEIYMWKNPLLLRESFNKGDLHLLVDKSVDFELAAFLLASQCMDHPDAAVARYIAIAFWLIDDLCDFVEDIHCKRRNSLLFCCVPTDETISLEERIELAYSNLEKMIVLLETCLKKLKSCTNSELYQFILNEVWEWSFNVRRMAE